MAFTAGVSRYQKKSWFDALVALAGLKIALFSTTTNLDANADPSVTPMTYDSLTADELGAVDAGAAAGYTIGGYALAGAAVAANGNGYDISFNDIATGSGTIAAGTYGAVLYDTNDLNRVLAIFTVTVTTGSSSGVMTITVPTNAINIG